MDLCFYLEEDLHFATANVRMVFGIVNQHGDFLRSDLLSAIAEHKQHRVDHVAFATAVGTDDRGEAFVKRPQVLFAGIRLEVFVLNVGDHKARALALEGQRWRRWRRDINTVNVDPAILIANFFASIFNLILENQGEQVKSQNR